MSDNYYTDNCNDNAARTVEEHPAAPPQIAEWNCGRCSEPTMHRAEYVLHMMSAHGVNLDWSAA